MSCTVAQRERAHDAAAALDGHAAVVAHDVLAPDTEPAARWSIDFVVEHGHAGVPAAVLRTLGRHGLAVRSVAPQGYYWQAVAVVADD